MVLFLLILFFLILIVYVFYRLGLLHVLQIFFLGLLCILSTIIIYLMLCPTTIKNFMFFHGNLQSFLIGVPNELIDQSKINALSEITKPNTGQILSNLANNIVDLVSQKPVDNSIQLENQTKLLTSIDQKVGDANILKEVQLSQYQEGQTLALQKLSTIDNSLNAQGKKLAIAVNNPLGVIDKLTDINSHVKPNLAILGELKNINYTLGQEKQLLSEGFNKMLLADGNNSLATDIQNLSSQLSTKFDAYQVNTEKSLQNMQKDLDLERVENKKLLEQVQVSSLADIEIAYEEAEKRIAAADTMVNSYKKHESLGQNTYNSGFNIPKIGSEGANQAATGIGTATALTWVLKFLRIV
jgi:hypothetical protein